MDRRLDNVFSLFIFFFVSLLGQRECVVRHKHTDQYNRLSTLAFVGTLSPPSTFSEERECEVVDWLMGAQLEREGNPGKGSRKPFTHTHIHMDDRQTCSCVSYSPFCCLVTNINFVIPLRKRERKKNEFVLLSSMKRSSCLSILVRKIVMSHNELLRFPSLTKINKTQGRKTHESLNRGDSKKRSNYSNPSFLSA